MLISFASLSVQRPAAILSSAPIVISVEDPHLTAMLHYEMPLSLPTEGFGAGSAESRWVAAALAMPAFAHVSAVVRNFFVDAATHRRAENHTQPAAFASPFFPEAESEPALVAAPADDQTHPLSIALQHSSAFSVRDYPRTSQAQIL